MKLAALLVGAFAAGFVAVFGAASWLYRAADRPEHDGTVS